MPIEWSPLWLSLRYAGLATLFAMLAAMPLAWLLASRDFPGSHLLDAAAGLPLVLPPAVLVYYLLAALGRWSLRFSWRTAVAVSAVYTLPLLLRMIRAGFAAVDPAFGNAARSLGAREWRVYWYVTLPLAGRPLWGAVLFGFVRSFVDFGATAILAGGASGWLLWPIAAAGLAALYLGGRLQKGQVPA